MSETQRQISPERIRELADRSEEIGCDNLAEWLNECAEEAENQ